MSEDIFDKHVTVEELLNNLEHKVNEYTKKSDADKLKIYPDIKREVDAGEKAINKIKEDIDKMLSNDGLDSDSMDKVINNDIDNDNNQLDDIISELNTYKSIVDDGSINSMPLDKIITIYGSVIKHVKTMNNQLDKKKIDIVNL